MAAIDGQAFFNENSRTLAPEAVGSQVAIMSVVSVSFIAPKIPMCLKPPRLVGYCRSLQSSTPQKQGTDDGRLYNFRTKMAIGSTIMLHPSVIIFSHCRFAGHL